MTPIPPNKALQDLTDAVTELYVRLDDSEISKFFKSTKALSKDLGDLLDLEVMKSGKKALNELTDAMQLMSDIQIKALASNRSLNSVISKDLAAASFEMGVSLRSLSEGVLQLNEMGITKLDRSTLLLVGRMKATGQDIGALSRHVGINNSLLGTSQIQAQQMAVTLSEYAQKLGATQSSILKMAGDFAETFQLQAALTGKGEGANLPQAFAALSSRFGGKADQLVSTMSKIFGKGDIAQLIQLGISEGFQESLLAEKDPAKQQAIMDQMIRTAAASVESKIGGLGKSAMDRQLASQLLQPLGGESALVFKQLADMLGEAREPVRELSESLTTFNSISEAFTYPLEFLGSVLLDVLNNPIIGFLAKGIAGLAGTALALGTGFTLFAASTAIFKWAVIKQIFAMKLAAFKMYSAAMINLIASNPLVALAGALLIGFGVFHAMSDDIKEINDKTPDTREKTNAGLTGQIFSQLINIVTSTNTNYIQKEMLITQRELVRLARQQSDWANPNNGPVTKVPQSYKTVAGG